MNTILYQNNSQEIKSIALQWHTNASKAIVAILIPSLPTKISWSILHFIMKEINHLVQGKNCWFGAPDDLWWVNVI
jgi:hypothetical protein